MRLLLDTCALVALAEREPMRDEAIAALRAAQAAGAIFVGPIARSRLPRRRLRASSPWPRAGRRATGSRLPWRPRAFAICR